MVDTCIGNNKRCWSVLDYENDNDLLQALEYAKANPNDVSVKDGFSPWEVENLDPTASFSQSLENEFARLKALRSYGILEAPPDERFERITALVSRIFNVPIALVSFVDMGRQWFLSNRGLGDVRDTPRDVAFCAHAILSTQDLFIVPDTLNDERFCHNGLVTGGPRIRFYAGAPLVCPEGFKLGTLCIIDSVPRPDGLTLMEKQNLRELAAFVVDNLVQRRVEIEQSNEDKYKIIACTAHDLLTPLFGIQLNLSLIMDDEKLWNSMNSHQKDLVQSASSCTDIMSRICDQAIENYRGSLKKKPGTLSPIHTEKINTDKAAIVSIAKLVADLRCTIETYPKSVPIYFEIGDDVPPEILSNDAILFRSALNYLTNACKVTRRGAITLRIFTRTSKSSNERDLVIEVHDSGPGIDANIYPGLFLGFRANSANNRRTPSPSTPNAPKSIGLGLSSVASNISALNGEYGFNTKEEKFKNKIRRCHSTNSFLSLSKRQKRQDGIGCVFWFSIPIKLPDTTAETPKITNKKLETQNLIESLNDLTKTIISESPVLPNVFDQLGNIDINLSPRSNSQNGTISKGRSTSSLTGIQESNINNNYQNDNFGSFLSTPKSFTMSTPSNCNRIVEENKSRPKTALIIDDSLTIRKSIERALSNLGFKVSQAENGMIGLQCMKRKTFDLVLCDFLMPIMDGLDCVKQYRRWEADHRSWFRQYIIGISAHASPHDADCGLGIGMDMFLTKPLKLKTIKELVVSEKVIAQSKILDALSKQHELNTHNISNEVIHKADNEHISVAQMDELDAYHLNGPVCLIADDSKTVCKSLARAIEKKGYRATWVQNGEDALRLLKMRNWDVVFLDEQMPHLSGTSCVARFRTWELRNRVVRQKNIYLLSGDIDSTSIDSGFDGSLEKPLKLPVLYNVLEKIKISSQCNPQEILLRY